MLSCEVASIYDGDTMRVRCDGELIKIRLYCIDAPEMGQKPWGRESRDYLRSITPERVMMRPVTKDRYGRTVGELFASPEESTSLNLALIETGQAAAYPKYCNESRYYQAQDKARSLGLGIWAKAGLQQRPWEWRRG